MTGIILSLWRDEDGFILSAELVLIGTIAVLSLVVGLAAVAAAVNTELLDCASAFGSFEQSNDRYGDQSRGGGRGGRSNGGDADLVGWRPGGN